MSIESKLRELYNKDMEQRKAVGSGIIPFEDWKYHKENVRRAIAEHEATKRKKKG